MRYAFHTHRRLIHADTQTLIGLYLRVRDRYPGTALLESGDSRFSDGDYSFIYADPVAGIRLDAGTLTTRYPDGSEHRRALEENEPLTPLLQEFLGSLHTEQASERFNVEGLVGYIGYETVRHFETVQIEKAFGDGLPDLRLDFYRFVLVIDHVCNQLYLIERLAEGQTSGLDALAAAIVEPPQADYPFETEGEETSDCTEETFQEMVAQAKAHCRRGDVFQLVLSRAFRQGYRGDDFQVYRMLRSLNPSPYLFYIDYGDYRLLGSSPEAQLKMADGSGVLHPIAGTFRRTGDPETDRQRAKELSEDPKETAEHTMLVDLARNDLSRHFSQVEVAAYKEVKFYSHVMHLVSEVVGSGPHEGRRPMDMLASCFPAGTLSGAPKYRALQLIDRYERTGRGFYGGCLGFIGLDGSVNMAILIRSLLSRNGVLHYRAGAGIVASSSETLEEQEVHHKVAALRTAIRCAENKSL